MTNGCNMSLSLLPDDVLRLVGKFIGYSIKELMKLYFLDKRLIEILDPKKVDSGFDSISPEEVEIVSRWRSLQEVFLRHCDRETSGAFSHLGNLGRVVTLDLFGSLVQDKDLKAIAEGNKGIETLTLTQNMDISDEGLKSVAQHGNLVKVDVSGCYHVTHYGITYLADTCPMLNSLSVQGRGVINRESMESLSRGCKRLERLTFDCCSLDLSTVSRMEVPTLTHLTVRGDHKFSDLALLAVVQECKNIQHLDIAGCRDLTSAAMPILQNNLDHLTELDISYCRNIPVEEMPVLLTGEFRELKKLIVAGIQELTDPVLHHLIHKCPNIECLDISRSPLLTGSSIINLYRCERLTNVYINNCGFIEAVDVVQYLYKTQDPVPNVSVTLSSDSGVIYSTDRVKVHYDR